MTCALPDFAQTVQLQSTTWILSCRTTRKRTFPQWHPPSAVRVMAKDGGERGRRRGARRSQLASDGRRVEAILFAMAEEVSLLSLLELQGSGEEEEYAAYLEELAAFSLDRYVVRGGEKDARGGID